MASTDTGGAIDAIKALLRCVCADGAQVAHVLLTESQQDAKLRKLTLTKLEPGMLVLATDEGRKQDKDICMSPLFSRNGSYDHNRACDAVLIRQEAQGISICYIELKSDKPSGYEGQFISTQCFMRYLIDLVNCLCGVEVRIARERFVVFHTDSKDASRQGKKTTTSHKPGDATSRGKQHGPSSPLKYCVRNDCTIRWGEIL